jgi:hypothetical protein
MEECREILGTVNEYYIDDIRFQSSTAGEGKMRGGEGEVNIADKPLFALLQFAKVLYSI